MKQVAHREEAHIYQTKHDLPAYTRADVIVILNARLADRMDLMHQATQAHGHVKGPSFLALHTLFDEVVDAAEDAMDLLRSASSRWAARRRARSRGRPRARA